MKRRISATCLLLGMAAVFTVSRINFRLGTAKDGNHVVPASPVTVFTKPTSEGREIVVVKGPAVAATRFVDVLSEESVARRVACHEIRVELREPHAPPVLLSSRISFDGSNSHGFDVLDLQVGTNQIVIATGELDTVLVWQLDLLTGTLAMQGLRSTEWNSIPTPYRYDRTNTKAAFGRTADGKKWAIDLRWIGKSAQPGDHRRFEQTDVDGWTFEPVGPNTVDF